jgi:hypothetical protein
MNLTMSVRNTLGTRGIANDSSFSSDNKNT